MKSKEEYFADAEFWRNEWRRHCSIYRERERCYEEASLSALFASAAPKAKTFPNSTEVYRMKQVLKTLLDLTETGLITEDVQERVVALIRYGLTGSVLERNTEEEEE